MKLLYFQLASYEDKIYYQDNIYIYFLTLLVFIENIDYILFFKVYESIIFLIRLILGQNLKPNN